MQQRNPQTPARTGELKHEDGQSRVSAMDLEIHDFGGSGGNGDGDGDDGGVSFPKREREEEDMDMTPMVDVTFLLLIFFMVTAAFSLQKSIQIPNPKKDEPSTKAVEQEEEEPADTVTVLIDSYNTYRVMTPDWEEEAPSEQELFVKLRAARQGDSSGNVPTKLLVRAHIDALHEKVVSALDAGTEVGMEEVQLMTVEEDE